MANLRNLVGKYVMRNEPVELEMSRFAVTARKDYNFTYFDDGEKWFCEAIIGDTPILLNKITGQKIVISIRYDDNNWNDMTDVFKYLSEGKEELND